MKISKTALTLVILNNKNIPSSGGQYTTYDEVDFIVNQLECYFEELNVNIEITDYENNRKVASVGFVLVANVESIDETIKEYSNTLSDEEAELFYRFFINPYYINCLSETYKLLSSMDPQVTEPYQRIRESK